MDPTYSILENEATTIITKLPVNHHPGSIIRGMFLGNTRLKVKCIFWNLCCQAVIRSESFLFECGISVIKLRLVCIDKPCNCGSDRQMF
jgi:hypothetical protein